MTVLYEAFLNEPNKQVAVLIEVIPKETLRGWSLVSGRTNTWSRVTSNFAGVDVIQGGIYRKFVGVGIGSGIVGATDTIVEVVNLTLRTSIAAVEAASSSWYYDEQPLGTDSTLYVHTPASVNPDTIDAAAIGKFRVHFSTVPKTFNGIFYEPRITPQSLPDVHEETEDLFFGPIKKVSQGEIGINNGDGLFDKLSVNWSWKNADVKLFLGGNNLAHTPGGNLDYEIIGSFQVEDISPRTDEFTLFVRDIQKQTFRQLPVRPMQKGLASDFKFPDLPQSSEGILLPHIYGAASGVECHVVNTLAQGRDYYIADRVYQTLFDIVTVYDDGVVVPEGSSGWGPGGNLTACEFRINSGYGQTVGKVTCDVIGKPVQGKPWETSTDYLKFYGEIVADIYTTFMGVPDADIDSAAALNADSDAPFAQSLVIIGDDKRSRRSARVFIRQLEVGVLGRTIKTLSGVIKPTVWIPGFSGPDSKILEDADIVEFDPDPTIETLFSKVFIYGDPITGGGEHPNATVRGGGDSWGIIVDSEDLETRFLQLDGRSEERSIFTNLVSTIGAGDLAEKVLALSKFPDINVRIVETGIRLMNSNVGDRLLVTFNRAPHRTGAWEGVPVEIISITKSFAPVPQVEVVVNNLKGTGEFVGLFTSSLYSPYLSASDLEKVSSGYWSDSLGLIDPSDLDTRNISVWW